MEIASAFRVIPSDGERSGAFAVFPYDRELVRRFREAFPRARWRNEEQRWFVPGTTATRRLDTWVSRELENFDRYADAKGRDAFSFEPLKSPYLTVAEDLGVRTPYSQTIVEAMRAIPWARWDPEERIWRVPFRAYEELRQRWPEIEAAARRNEPAERRRRRDEHKAQSSRETSHIQAERRRRRYPVPGDDLPPLGAPVATNSWGVVTFEDIESDTVAEPGMEELYPHVTDDPARYVWARWRMPTLQEIYRTRPSREDEDAETRVRQGWWWPSRDELQERARKLREIERAQRSRRQLHKSSVDA
ncbi:hypothetical protein [Microvirga roseola]|uniref:hypothetical protein n=1 Tax=Microvirga roseola TaxID=2883126 RepID=UPI001E298EB1|nr:hypothetical protein [Microvirga roseola]